VRTLHLFRDALKRSLLNAGFARQLTEAEDYWDCRERYSPVAAHWIGCPWWLPGWVEAQDCWDCRERCSLVAAHWFGCPWSLITRVVGDFCGLGEWRR
jgi:hypothetical protein